MAEIEFSAERGTGFVLLNRPQALNALTLDMCLGFEAELTAWAADPAIRAVIIRGAGERAYCAGGDIKQLHAVPPDRRVAVGQAFFRAEYRLNYRLRMFPKPSLSLVHGIVMGGGVGVSVHASHRVVSEDVTWAMPEMGIGMFADIGCSFVLPRAPGRIGLYLALTGARLGSADCLYARLADHIVPRARHEDLVAAIVGGETPERAIARFRVEPGPAPLATQRAEIDRVFALDGIRRIAAEHPLAGSPTAQALTVQQMNRGARLPFAECMRMEWRMVNRVIAGHDFYEGIRAQLVDKDRNPKWRPASLDLVQEAAIARHFDPLPGDELNFA